MEAHYAACAHTGIGLYVTAIWQVEGMPPHRHETILPKGIVELIFSFADPLRVALGSEGASQPTPTCFISGLNTVPLQLRAPQAQALFGVQLTPLAVRKLLRVPAGEFLNRITDLRLLSPAFGSLADQLAGAGSFAGRRALVEAWVQRQLQEVPKREVLLSSYLNTPAVAAPSVAELAARACYSPRQLSRKAHELFGISAEALLGYKRYVGALQALHQPGKTLTTVGLECGYYDQAHFIREFRHFTGMAPGGYRRQLSARPGHLFQ
ncbi:helix-turn-helix transcriptional regulator [Hymenobacter busanensis]|uniref:Helix-turn-helix transcriptional regulator n=1 Tax=Hymenobacter busanensis TaxID=2607656 RepID=A0A7L4ZU46_9BACT|nr:AraC family transcriptional regulator [Hymenobacter busanensis]KAA9339314.1 helix-turn-helix transcriptional regulator [Hymenobacter busanensis]QHJ06924.1 helix-turn-helix domain-containing protein [Hymenobacter busanensis]